MAKSENLYFMFTYSTMFVGCTYIFIVCIITGCLNVEPIGGALYICLTYTIQSELEGTYLYLII